ncbi:MAG: DNA polymerase III subunit delta' [Flavobacteriales bacterium]|nr:DNA polymerase III subunit delta' [Flavobacteriales bacterium]
MLFKEVLGQEKLKELLMHSVREGRVPHAQLFLGSKGSANLALALALAQYVACNNKQQDDSCGKCPSCLKHLKFVHPDLHFVFPVATTSNVKTKPISKNFLSEWRDLLDENPYFSVFDWLKHIGVDNKQGLISVEESAHVLKDLSLKPFEGETKMMLIWMPEKMNVQAANKLLKIIEEPPQKTLFLFVAESTENMLATVLSRTQLIKVPRHSDEDLENYLTNRGVEQSKVKMISALVEGNINEALQLADYVEDAEQNSLSFVKWMRLCFSALQVKDIDKLVQWSEKMAKAGRENQKSFLLYASNVMRDALLKNYGVETMMKMNLGGQDFTMEKFAPFIHAGNCMEIISELNMAQLHIERNANPKILFLDTSFKIARLLHKKLNQVSA